MYLYKKHYVGNKYKEPEEQVTVNVPVSSSVGYIRTERISEITEMVAYWRKANAIHKWFIDNCAGGDGDKTEMYVSKDQLQELLDTVDKVLSGTKLIDGKVHNGTEFSKGVKKEIMEEGKIVEDSTIAKELLPTESGFFFGGTDYDQYYYDDLVETKKVLEQILGELANDKSYPTFSYEASW